MYFALLAGFFQFTRTALQKNLTGNFSPVIITWLRFLIGLPFAAITVLFIFLKQGYFPALSLKFLFYILCAALFQIAGSVMMMNLFKERNFIVGIGYSKTETIFAAVLGFVIFDETVNTYSLLAIIVGFFGVFMLSLVGKMSEGVSLKNFYTKASAIGLVLGIFHAATAVYVREATLQIHDENPVIRSAITLFFMFLTQSVLLTPYVLKFCEQDIVKTYAQKNGFMLMGCIGFVTSMLWFVAYSVQNAAYVNAVGQVEIVFSMLATHLIFKEKVKWIELLGIMLITVSIMTIIFI